MRQLLKSSSIYGSADVITKSIALLMIPVYTHFLAVPDYGRLSLYQSFAGVLSTTMLWGTTASLASFYHFREYRDQFDQIKENTVRFLLSFNLFIVLLFFMAGRAIGTDTVLTGLVLAIAYFATVRSVQSVHFIHSSRPRHQFALVVSFAVMSAIFVIAALIFVTQFSPVTRIFSALAVTGLLFLAIMAVTNRFYATQSFDWTLIKAVLVFGLPILPHALSQWTLNFADRAMLRFFLDYREVGLYSLGYNFGMVMLVFLGAVNASWSPAFMRIAENEENAPQILSRMANHVWRIFCLGAAAYLLWINELITIATPAEYHSAVTMSKLIVISYLIYGSYLLYANGLFVAKKTRLVPVATITAAVVNILMNGLLIPAHGAYGAVAATAVSFATMTVLIYIMARKYYPLSVGPGSLAVPALVPLAYFIFSVILDARFDLISRSAGKVVLTIPLILYAYAKIRRKSPDS